jgi:hypothetical protein
LGAQAALVAASGYRAGELVLAFGDGEHHHLHRGQPGGEGASEVLDQNAEEALDGAEQHAMDDHRRARLIIAVNELQLEAAGQIKVKLHRAALPFAAH